MPTTATKPVRLPRPGQAWKISQICHLLGCSRNTAILRIHELGIPVIRLNGDKKPHIRVAAKYISLLTHESTLFN